MTAKTGRWPRGLSGRPRPSGATLDARARETSHAGSSASQEWNARIDLTAARSDDELVDLMLADALRPRAAHPDRCAASSTWARAPAPPGLALALLRPDLRVTLVEPLGKRAAFLRTVRRRGRPRRRRHRARARRGPRGRRAWDVAVSRATLAPPAWLDLAVTLAAPGGSAWVLLAKDEAPAHARAVVEEDIAYTWPLARRGPSGRCATSSLS